MSRLAVVGFSVRQPWAALIVHGHKTVENRTWNTTWRGTLAIHAPQKIDRATLAVADQYGIAVLHTGVYLGFVDLVDVHHANICNGCTDWSEPRRWHWVLSRPRRLPRPIPGRGHLGLYEPPVEVTVARLALELGEDPS